MSEANDAVAYLTLAVASSDVGTFDYDLVTGVLDADSRAKRAFGVDEQATITYAEFLALVHPADRGAVDAQIAAATDPSIGGLLDEASFRTEYRVLRPDGEVHWIHARGRIYFTGTGAERRALRFLGTVADVSARHAADAWLRASETRYRGLVESAPSFAWVNRPDGSVEFFNRRWYEHTGQDESYTDGRWIEAIHADDRALVRRARERGLAAAQPYEVEFRVRGRDGRYRWVFGQVGPLVDEVEPGRIAGWYGTALDIDDRRRREDADRALAAASRALSESLDYADTLRAVAELAVPALADLCVVDMREGDGVRRLAETHASPAMLPTLKRTARYYDSGPIGDHALSIPFDGSRPRLLARVTEEHLVRTSRSAEHLADILALAPRSIVTAPLIARGETIGVMSLAFAETSAGGSGREYGEGDLPLIEELARRAAYAVDNARLYGAELVARTEAESYGRQLREQAAALARANEAMRATSAELAARTSVAESANARVAFALAISDAAAAGRTLDEVLDTLLTRMRAALVADTAAVMLFDATADYLTVRAAQGMDALTNARLRVPFGEGVAGGVAKRGEPLVLRDTEADDAGRYIRAIVRSAAGVPLVTGGRTIGVLQVGTHALRDFTSDDVALLQLVAGRVAGAVERARLADAEAVARVRAERMLELAGALARAVTVDDVARAAVDGGAALVGGFGGSMVVVDDADGAAPTEAEFVYAVGYSEAQVAKWSRFPIALATPFGDVIRSGEPVFLGSLGDWTARYPHLADSVASYGHAALAALPLRAGGHVAGVLGVGFAVAREFGDDDRLLLAAVADQASVALERALLLEREQRLRAAAQAASRAKSDFLATTSHEIRTPINAILGYNELMDMEIAGPVTALQRSYLQRQMASGRHLLGIVNEILDLAKVESGQLEVGRERAGLHAAAQDALTLVRPQAAAGDVALWLEPAPDDDAYLGDPARVRQILVNLLSNAVKFTPAGGRVAVQVVVDPARPDAVSARVTDTGIGIPSHRIESAFEPFVQLDQGRTRQQGGTGLGLAISRELARLMGGELSAESEVGRGSTFTLRLPAAGPAAEPPDPR